MPARPMIWNEAEDKAHGLVARLALGKPITVKDLDELREIAEWTTTTRETMELFRTMAQTGPKSASSQPQMIRFLSKTRWTTAALTQRRD